ncbi:MAG TPA: chloride channel protein [Ktedonobacteraceae bacterium]|jgi:H+/Cl- antiporter ClcA
MIRERETVLLIYFWRKQTGWWDSLENHEAPDRSGDVPLSLRSIGIVVLAVVIGAASACIVVPLLQLIGLITNLTFYHHWDVTLVSPAKNTLGLTVVLVPVVGSLAVGLLARYGSERIRGHGIPEALNATLTNESHIGPKVALLKSVASAIAIGTGSPFGAGEPVMITGGAFGAIVAQCFHLTSTERRVLLAAGVAGGMAAIFHTPIAATLLAMELVLLEWKAQNLAPLALASVTATVVRSYLPVSGMDPGVLFTTPLHTPVWNAGVLFACILGGVLAGLLAALLTVAVYGCEHLFHKLPIHWMWWPVIGGAVIGLGGIISPPVLGVGYDLIHQMLLGNVPLQMLVGLLIVKSIIWAISLSSGTSGGILAPLLLIGGALGGVEDLFLPHVFPGFWPLLSMTAVLGAATGCPFTCIIFAVELTHNFAASLPLVLVTLVAYVLVVLVMPHSILPEKVNQRGLHIRVAYRLLRIEKRESEKRSPGIGNHRP